VGLVVEARTGGDSGSAAAGSVFGEGSSGAGEDESEIGVVCLWSSVASIARVVCSRFFFLQCRQLLYRWSPVTLSPQVAQRRSSTGAEVAALMAVPTVVWWRGAAGFPPEVEAAGSAWDDCACAECELEAARFFNEATARLNLVGLSFLTVDPLGTLGRERATLDISMMDGDDEPPILVNATVNSQKVTLYKRVNATWPWHVVT
jgi:hypothetical protein